jgi:hypothetical protein
MNPTFDGRRHENGTLRLELPTDCGKRLVTSPLNDRFMACRHPVAGFPFQQLDIH